MATWPNIVATGDILTSAIMNGIIDNACRKATRLEGTSTFTPTCLLFADSDGFVEEVEQATYDTVNGEISLKKPLVLEPVAAGASDLSESSNCGIFLKGGKLIIQYDDAGTVRYKSLTLTGTGVTWVHSTTLP